MTSDQTICSDQPEQLKLTSDKTVCYDQRISARVIVWSIRLFWSDNTWSKRPLFKPSALIRKFQTKMTSDQAVRSDQKISDQNDIWWKLPLWSKKFRWKKDSKKGQQWPLIEPSALIRQSQTDLTLDYTVCFDQTMPYWINLWSNSPFMSTNFRSNQPLNKPSALIKKSQVEITSDQTAVVKKTADRSDRWSDGLLWSDNTRSK